MRAESRTTTPTLSRECCSLKQKKGRHDEVSGRIASWKRVMRGLSGTCLPLNSERCRNRRGVWRQRHGGATRCRTFIHSAVPMLVPDRCGDAADRVRGKAPSIVRSLASRVTMPRDFVRNRAIDGQSLPGPWTGSLAMVFSCDGRTPRPLRALSGHRAGTVLSLWFRGVTAVRRIPD